MLEQLAQLLDEAALTGKAVPQLTLSHELSVEQAYQVQAELIARRERRGERLVGLKMGLTSKAKMAQVGVSEVIWGRLTDAGQVADGGTVDAGRFIHPRVEPEVAFLIGEGGAPVAVAPAIELIDSRYENFKFTLVDVVADNTSAGAYAIGPWSPIPAGVDNLGVLFEVDGHVVQVGSTAAILGDPRRAFEAGMRLSAEAHVEAEPGWVMLAGAATEAVPLRPGAHVRAIVQGLGSVSLRAAA